MAVALGLGAVLVGFVGSQLLETHFQRRDAADFLGVVNSAVSLIANTPWQEPWENDPAWLQLEQELKIDILPIRAGDQSQIIEPTGQVEWSQSAGGFRRMSLLAELPRRVPSPRLTANHQREFVRVTRELPSNGLQSTWWFSWGLLCLLGAALTLTTLNRHQAEKRKLAGLLNPWLEAVRNRQRQPFVLPAIESSSELEPTLAIVSESVNEVVGELYGENQRSELVLGNLQEGVLAIDEGSRILLLNNALYRLLGLSQEAYLDRLLLELVRLPIINEVAERVLREQVPCEALMELAQPQRSLRVLGRPLPLGRNRFGALLTIRDETMLRRIELVRRDFVANASHELKTPLAAIRAYAETLQLGALDDRPMAEQFVGNIIEQADRINGLVQGMLQLSRVEAGTALKFERFDACEAAQPCIAAALAVARGKNIEVKTLLPNNPLEIYCDRDGFQTIVSNLLSNAVRYTHDGGRVSVALDFVSQYCVLRVTDTGIGIHPEDLERIFERFYRAEKDRSTETGGTGLGLSIVKHLTQALGGTVLASSQPDSGSSFEVRLPISGGRPDQAGK